jgi:hypothetical protein
MKNCVVRDLQLASGVGRPRHGPYWCSGGLPRITTKQLYVDLHDGRGSDVWQHPTSLVQT